MCKNCINNPGEFYLIPHAVGLLMPALPIYLAAFDGHKEIFLLGYSTEMRFDNPRWFNDVYDVIAAYSGIQFYLVGESTNMPDLWLECANTKTMNYREFVGYCDI